MKSKLVAFADAHLVPNWRQWHRMWSVRLTVLWTALQVVWEVWPYFQGFMPARTFIVVTVALAIAVIVARLAHQEGVTGV